MPALRALLDQVLRSGGDMYQRRDVVQWLGWEGPAAPGTGLPIGNLTSQWWGNLYLDGLDHFVLRQLRPRGYQRYMDDLVIFGRSETDLARLRGQLAEHAHDLQRAAAAAQSLGALWMWGV